MPMYGMPAGLAAFSGAGYGRPGFMGAFGGGLEAFGQAQADQSASSDRQLQGILDIARMEQQIRSAEAAQQEKQRAQAAALAQQGQAEELRMQLPEQYRELFDVDQKTAIARAFPEAAKPGDRYRVVGNQLFDIGGQAPKLAATSPRDEGLVKVVGEDGLPRYVPESQARGQVAPSSQGITIGPDGTIQIGGQATPLGKKAQGEIETGLIAAGAGMERLNAISQSYDPKYTTYQGAAEAATYRQAEKAGVPIGDQRREYLRGFTTWRTEVGNNLSRYVKEISGFAATDNERAHLAKNLPSTNDSDTEFQAKWASKMKELKMVEARLNFIRNNGLSAGKDFAGISLSAMPKLVNERGQQIEQQLRAANPQAPDEAIREMARKQLKAEFGI